MKLEFHRIGCRPAQGLQSYQSDCLGSSVYLGLSVYREPANNNRMTFCGWSEVHHSDYTDIC